jgi:alpha-methylacyl-CoA racemase
MSHGPLAGVRVLEFAGIGPGPFAAMLLADLGADVVRIDRPEGGEWPNFPIVSRGRASILVDLKTREGVQTCLAAIERADVLIEGFRPGVMERVGLGPDVALARNPKLIFGRVTGWGQTGSLAKVAGHDINYIALAGALAPLGGAGAAPLPPLNLLGDYAGGSLYLVVGILAALLERNRSQQGQVIDAAIVDGAASMLAPLLGMAAAGVINLDRTHNILGGVAPNYRTYVCADGRYVAVGPLEPRFYAQLCAQLGIEARPVSTRNDMAGWEEVGAALARVFATRSRDEWATRLEQLDVCVTPVLTPEEAALHPHLSERQTYVVADGHWQPAAAPRFSRTPAPAPSTSPADGQGGAERLAAWGVQELTTRA